MTEEGKSGALRVAEAVASRLGTTTLGVQRPSEVRVAGAGGGTSDTGGVGTLCFGGAEVMALGAGPAVMRL